MKKRVKKKLGEQEFVVRARITVEWSGTLEANTAQEAEEEARNIALGQGAIVDWDVVISCPR